MHCIVIICGPTASGKTRAGIELALKVGGEIVSADSQQVWRHFDIGTAKSTAAERAAVPHHLIDIAEPKERFDAAQFVGLADAAIEDITSRGRMPIVVGGTGMYLRMLVCGMCEAPPRDPDVRSGLEGESEKYGLKRLYERLIEVDPESASKIKSNDPVRIIRALEIHRITGIPACELRKRHDFGERRYEAEWIGLTLERKGLYSRIDSRVDAMIANGLLEEARALRDRYGDQVQPFAAVGYKEMASHLRGEISFDEAVRLIKQNTRRFAKRQLTWFRAEPAVVWYSGDDIESIAASAHATSCL
ncbi:MAG: tRNA (adenosine(37)-N6)-dimethylallyltransferase MiaA [bacterium]